MKNNLKIFIHNLVITLIILVAFFFISLGIDNYFNMPNLITPIFVLAVFLVSLVTKGYVFGIISSLISVLAVNYAFTFPYFAFNFTMQENMISAVILITITVTTCTLTTKIKEQEKVKLQAETEKMKANLLRGVSHDLRTPLTSIYGASSTIIENFDALDMKDKIDILMGIQKDSKWLIRMVENLLSVTRIDSSNVKVVKSSVVLEELIDSVLFKFKKNYPDFPVILDIPEEFITVSADALLIEQVLLNLLENAVCHARGMTELKLNIFVKDDKTIFEVVDNGCGIEKEKLRNIFSGYYTSSQASTDGRKGSMGVGLSVCATIIKAHGGEITAENNKKGGMKFRFILDLEEIYNEQ